MFDEIKFQQMIDRAVEAAIEKHLPKQQKTDEFLKVEEVCAITKKARSTLWKWERAGLLIPSRVGKELRYKRSEVDALMNGGNRR